MTVSHEQLIRLKPEKLGLEFRGCYSHSSYFTWNFPDRFCSYNKVGDLQISPERTSKTDDVEWAEALMPDTDSQVGRGKGGRAESVR